MPSKDALKKIDQFFEVLQGMSADDLLAKVSLLPIIQDIKSGKVRMRGQAYLIVLIVYYAGDWVSKLYGVHQKCMWKAQYVTFNPYKIR